MSTNQPRPLALTLSAVLLALLCAIILGPAVAKAGTVTIVDGTDAPVGGTYTDGWIQDHLNITGSLTISTTGVFTGPDDILVQAGVEVKWTTGVSLTLHADRDIVISGTIQHNGPESGDGGLRLQATKTVTVGTGLQTTGVAAGSRHGLTRVDAVDLVLKGGSGGTDPFAMLGFRDVNQGAAFTVTGPISVTVRQHVTATGGITNAFVQVGHGGADKTFDFAVDGNFVGPVAIEAGGNVFFLGGGRDAYAQLGNGGAFATGNHAGDHRLDAGGIVFFQGGTGVLAYAQLGNGGHFAVGNHSGSHILQATSGEVIFQGGGSGAYAQLGNGGRSSLGNHSGSHSLHAIAGDVFFLGIEANAQLGNGGGLFANGDHSGSLALTTTSNLVVAAGSGKNAYAMLGHGSDTRDNPVNNGAGSRSGDISVLVGATAILFDAHIGHLTANGTLSVTHGSTLVGVSQNDPTTGTGQLIATGVVSFTSAPAANGGQLRLYLPRRDSQLIPTATSFNGESFASANTIPEDHIRGFYLFGEGPYVPSYSFYLGPADVGIAKRVSPTSLLRPGDPLTYTLSFSNTGTVTTTGVLISDTLPGALTDVNITDKLDAGVLITKTGSAPDLAWQVSDLGVGQGGLITISAILSDEVSLLGTSISNTVSITSTGDVTPTNNGASASSSVISPATLVITKVVHGPEPDADWPFIGSDPIGSFSLPAEGGSTPLTPLLPDTSYIISETVRAEYTPSVTCTTGQSGAFSVTLTTPGPTETIGCTFTNTYITQTLTVSKVVSGGPLTADDFDLFVNGDTVTNGVPTKLVAGAHTVTESNVPSYTAAFSGDCDTSGVVELAIGQQALCVLTNTFIPSGAGTVLGTVVSEDSTGIERAQVSKDGAGIEGAQVTLSNEVVVIRAALLRTESTDADGAYLFEDVPAGTYSLTVEAEGYQASDPVTVTVIEDETTAVDPVILQEESTDTALYLPAVSSNSAAVASATRVEQLRHIFLPSVVH